MNQGPYIPRDPEFEGFTPIDAVQDTPDKEIVLVDAALLEGLSPEMMEAYLAELYGEVIKEVGDTKEVEITVFSDEGEIQEAGVNIAKAIGKKEILDRIAADLKERSQHSINENSSEEPGQRRLNIA